MSWILIFLKQSRLEVSESYLNQKIPVHFHIAINPKKTNNPGRNIKNLESNPIEELELK